MTEPQCGAVLSPAKRIYAIGDVHGRLDLLEDLLQKIGADLSARPGPASTLVFLGDLVDRGPESAQVVEYLRQLQIARAPGSTRFLLGNHEEVLLAALAGDDKAFRFFCRIGGRETILSYGVDENLYADLDYSELLEAFQALVPQAHIEFLNTFEDMIVEGDYAFVHAGIDPRRPLADQRIKDLRWIRDAFIDFAGSHEKVVVHGHTIARDVEQLPNRIGLDTGAYVSGKLTAMGFEGSERWVLQTG